MMFALDCWLSNSDSGLFVGTPSGGIHSMSYRTITILTSIDHVVGTTEGTGWNRNMCFAGSQNEELLYVHVQYCVYIHDIYVR